ncbi:MAG: thiamine pyrophosphate-dependent enzyme, partial [Gammaproteobacteria bacterium]
MKTLQSDSYLSGDNAAYLESLLESPAPAPAPAPAAADSLKPVIEVLARKQTKVTQLIEAYRLYGHYRATLDPLGLAEQPAIPELESAHYDLTAADSQTVFNAEALNGFKQASLHDIHAALLTIYCGNIGFEYMHIVNTEQREWIRQRIEQPRIPFASDVQRRILEQLTAAEGWERYLGSKYVGQKRFSLEGTDSLIPLLDNLIQRASKQQVKNIVIGMAHRGRLNVLVNILGKSPAILFNEFEGKKEAHDRSGDVKYHAGYSANVKTEQGIIHLSLGSNPSHLEIIAPVVEGSVRARQDRQGAQAEQKVIPIILHGDAAFSGQGVVMETLNFSQIRGFSTGGTIHIVVNNQVGFTTSNIRDVRSTPYCTDVAKMIQAPILHVNADDPEAVLFAAQLAFDFRMQFYKDVVIDLVGYRRHGHNEA